jgi:putative phage-type endonuclease
MNAPEQHLDRSGFIGGSDIGAIMGLSKYQTPLQVYLEKIGQAPPLDPEKEKFFRRRKRLEPIVLDSFEEERGFKIVARNQRYVDPTHPFFGCEIDAEYEDGERINIEAKTSNPFVAKKQWGAEGSDDIGLSYAAQAMWGLGITGRQRCTFAVLIGDEDLQTFEIVRDEITIAAMRQRALRFWHENVIAQVPPEPINMDDIKRLLTKVNGRPVELDGNAAAWVEELRACRESGRKIEQLEEAALFKIADYVRRQWALDADEQADDDAILMRGGQKIATWKKQSRATLDAKALTVAHPAIAAQYQRTAHFRVMRTVTPKE